jgi:hypothetical protein
MKSFCCPEEQAANIEAKKHKAVISVVQLFLLKYVLLIRLMKLEISKIFLLKHKRCVKKGSD